MKKVFLFVLLAVSCFLATSAFTPKTVGGTLHIYVKDSYGNPADYVRVNYDVCASLSCAGGGSDVRTDKKGYAEIRWTTSCDICTIYVNGKSHKGKYTAGNSYTFSND